VDVEQKISKRVGVIDQATANFDDGCLVTKLSNPAKCFDQCFDFWSRLKIIFAAIITRREFRIFA